MADFYGATMEALAGVGATVTINPWPQELPDVVPFPDDTVLRPYDADAAQRFWLALVQMHRVMRIFRARFQGKVSPVHFFWGAADLAVTRFSGPGGAPPSRWGTPLRGLGAGDGLQPRGEQLRLLARWFTEGTFYAYAYPVPEGFADGPWRRWRPPTTRRWASSSSPTPTCATAADPEAELLAFFQSTYEAAAELADWDRVHSRSVRMGRPGVSSGDTERSIGAIWDGLLDSSMDPSAWLCRTASPTPRNSERC